MSDVGKIGGALGAATAINTSYQISRGTDPVPSIVTAGILFALLAGAGSLAGAGGLRVAKFFAYLILLGVVLGRGANLLTNVQKLTAGLTASPKKTNPIPVSPTH